MRPAASTSAVSAPTSMLAVPFADPDHGVGRGAVDKRAVVLDQPAEDDADAQAVRSPGLYADELGAGPPRQCPVVLDEPRRNCLIVSLGGLGVHCGPLVSRVEPVYWCCLPGLRPGASLQGLCHGGGQLWQLGRTGACRGTSLSFPAGVAPFRSERAGGATGAGAAFVAKVGPGGHVLMHEDVALRRAPRTGVV